MRQSLAIASTLVLVGGCSLIYNPNDLGKPADANAFHDAPPDVEVVKPADPSMLSLMEIYPARIDEGRGDSGSRPALLVVRGTNFDGSDNLVVTLSPDDAGETLTFDTTVASDHNFIALGVTAPVDPTCKDGSSHTYTVEVVEDGATVQQLPSALKLVCHDELTATTLDTGNLKTMYSQVKVTGSLTITGMQAAIIKSASNIEIDGTVSANASGQMPGPGGSAGGAIGKAGGGAGGGQTALANGGGAGFAAPGTGAGNAAGGIMIGEPSVTSYDTNYASGGGGDGTLGALGVVGGGGGGTIELTANGDITLATVTANGGGVNSATGGGAGGLIVVRPLGGTTHGNVALNVPGGTPGNAGSVGRTRVDGATDKIIVAGYHGPNFSSVPLYSAGVQTPTISTLAAPTEQIGGVVINRANYITMFSFTGGLDPGNIGYGPANAMPTLTSGYNQVCVIVKNGSSAVDVATDCIEMAYLP